MTDEQKRIYAIIVQFKRENDGNSPGIRTIAQAMGMDHKTMWRRVRQMEKGGYLMIGATDGQERIILGGEWTPPDWWREKHKTETVGDVQEMDRQEDQASQTQNCQERPGRQE